jgi:hypothetical protein
MPFVNNNQRDGYSSNSSVGSTFELLAQEYFLINEKEKMERNYEINLGLELKKNHKFDLGNNRTLVECKSHTCD